MPFVEVFTRERLPDEVRGTLGEALTTTMIEIVSVVATTRSSTLVPGASGCAVLRASAP